MLRIDRLHKSYAGPQGYLALADVTLDIAAGEFVCLLGPSGCGKSTLLNILAGFQRPSAGLVSADGQVITGPGRDRVMVFQDAGSALLPWQTVDENIRFALRVRGIPQTEWPARLDAVLTAVELTAHRRKFPAQLSGGMRQRLQIARALAVDPKVLLMDEPFGALDALTRRRMHKVMLDIWQRTGTTIVFVTHDITEALTLGDRVCVMSVGPGSTITSDIRVTAARPRDLGDPALGRLGTEIEALLAPDLAIAEARG